MSNQVDRTGTFRFDQVLECGVSKTKNGFPSFNVRLRLNEFFDEDEGTWVDWLPAEAEQTAYFTLFGKNKKTKVLEPCLNHSQIMKVFGWDGKSFQLLANADYSGIKGQLRIGDSTYDGAKSPFQVDWIDVYDADPVRQLRKLEANELKDLDAEFAQALQASGKAAAPAAAPSKKNSGPVPPAADRKPAPSIKKDENDGAEDGKINAAEPPVELTPAQRKAALKAKSDKNKAAKASKKPGPPTPPPARAKTEETVEETVEEPAAAEQEEADEKSYTKQQAWEIVVEMKADAVTDEQLNTAWGNAIEQVAGDVDDIIITKIQWGKIVDIVLGTEYEEGKTIGKF